MPVSIRFDKSGLLSPRPTLRRYTERLLEHCLADEGQPGAELTVLYCSLEYIHGLNRDYLGVDRPTDVLSFPAGVDHTALSGAPPYLGDLAVCLPYAAAQAPRFQRTPGQEVGLLLVHGFLHLLGWDHDTEAAERAMWARTDELLLASPVSPPTLRTTGLPQ